MILRLSCDCDSIVKSQGPIFESFVSHKRDKAYRLHNDLHSMSRVGSVSSKSFIWVTMLSHLSHGAINVFMETFTLITIKFKFVGLVHISYYVLCTKYQKQIFLK